MRKDRKSGSRSPGSAPKPDAGRVEAFLAAIVDSSSDAIISKDLDGRILTWNRSAERLFGYTAEEAVGQPVSFIIPAHRGNEGAHILARIKAGERVEHFDTERVAKDGSLIAISLTVSPIRDASGAIVGASKIARDIRERVAAEAVLLEREERLKARAAELQTIMDAVPAVVFIAEDAQCHSIRANRAGSEWLQVEAGANTSFTAGDPREIPRSFRVYRDGVELAPDELPVQRAARGETIRNFEEEVRFVDGKVHHMLGNAAPLLDEEGRPRGAVAAFVDISELKRVEQALRDANRRKDEFLAVLGHELRNPLSPITHGVEVLLVKSGGDSLVQWAAELIQRQVKHIGRLVDDLLDLSRISRGTLELRREAADAVVIIRDAAEAVKPLLAARKHSLDLRLPQQSLPVYVDPNRVIQVVTNLLNNAIKYTPEGGGIVIAARQAGNQLVIRVRDTGIGLASQDFERVFDLFTRAPGAAARSPGLGIGLTLVKRVVELHGGSVTVSSPGLGLGSEFCVSLPIAPAVTVPVVVGSAPREPAHHPRRILVVDDNQDGAQSLSMLLNSVGHQAKVAHTGTQACAMADFVPEIVFLDIDLPDMSGYEVARRFRRMFGAKVGLVALTGYGGEDAAERAHAAGFDLYVMKPIEAGRLHAVIDGLGVSRTG